MRSFAALRMTTAGWKPAARKRLVRRQRQLGQTLIGRQPAVEEAVDPAIEGRIVEGVHGEMDAALLDAGLFQPLGIQRPDLLHLERDLGMKLETEGVGP